ncbi:hypothetical protein MLD38_005977 [Melastoma candidum]|uniref:Uncharacterized protein n=1 Tax=Melastoma candidum TaxID=119954 RepID=A0ACB9RPG5_9MYRT|nr:hypothetical protein MLD38_005977 [Melastoma candidum]
MGRKVFEKMTARDAVDWTTLVIWYVHNGVEDKALGCLVEMVRLDQVDIQPNFRMTEGGLQACGNRDDIALDLKPNNATLVTVLTACSSLAGLHNGESINQFIHEQGIYMNVSLATALVDMYAKCRKINRAKQLFDLREERDAISWNVMIFAYGMHGDAVAAFEIFQLMENLRGQILSLFWDFALPACVQSY